MNGPIGASGVAVSLVLVALTLGLSWWWKLGLGRQLTLATARAAVQLLGAGLLFHFIIESASPGVLAAAWIVGMVVVAAEVVARRMVATTIRMRSLAAAAVGGTTLISLGVIFGFGILEPEPLSVVVIGGITIGNSVPAAALAGNKLKEFTGERRSELEAVLSLGFDRRDAVRFVVPAIVRIALIPQIETTKVVGLIALPGAMTGLLLAGVDPVGAVLAQIVVMYLVLGSVCTSAIIVTIGAAYELFTDDLRVAPGTNF